MLILVRATGAVLFVAAAALYGYSEAGSMMKRRKELRYLYQLLSIMKSEVNFGRFSLGEIFMTLSEKSREPYHDIFQMAHERLEHNREEFGRVWTETLEYMENMTCLKTEDLQDMSGLTELSAAMDGRLREEIFGQVFSRLEERMEQLKTEYQQKGKVYCYMGVTIGILGVIILI